MTMLIHLATAELQEDDASSHHSSPPALDETSVTSEGSDSTEDSAEGLPPATQTIYLVSLAKFASWQVSLTTIMDNNDTALIATMYDGNPEPKIYTQALKCSDFQYWWGAMCIEFKNMEDKQAWEITPKSSIPKGRKIIGSWWVFARKDDGRYWSRCISKEFSKIPGKDFQ
jgi:hypothetical protein